MKSFKETNKPANLAQELATLDNETVARIFLSVLQTRKDSAILGGIYKILEARLELSKEPEPSDQAELF